MDQHDKQFMYNGRLVDKEHFRAFVYSIDEQRLAKSYDEYVRHIQTGVWFDSPEKVIAPKKGKPKDDGNSKAASS